MEAEESTKKKVELIKIVMAVKLVMDRSDGDTETSPEVVKNDGDEKTDVEPWKDTSVEKEVDKTLTELTLNKLNTMKKEFTISGKVGEPTNEKDVGYLGVVRQMQEGAERGYTEKEIVAGVLRAIVPKSLKTYLGITPKLDTIKLAQILRIHYQEKSATELYQELITMKQTATEEAIAFVVRAFETREKNW